MNGWELKEGKSVISDKKVNVLLVDDQPENLIALEAVLGNEDLNLVKAMTGREALRNLLKQEFALILLDVQMPGMDGFETASLIREREKTENTPIIFLTAINRTDIPVFKGYSIGAVDYIVKPIAPEILKTKVSVFVELYKKTEQLRRQQEILSASEARLFGILNAAPDAVISINQQQRITLFNQSAEKIFGYTSADILNRPFGSILASKFVESEFQFIAEFIQLPEKMRRIATNRELSCLRKNGQEFPAEISISKVELNSEEVIIIIVRDITERKEADKLHNDLSRRLVMAQEEERQRISRELHDQIGQYLTALMLGLESLKKNYPMPETLDNLTQLQQFTNKIGQEVHHLALELRPTALDDLGLNIALVNYIQDWSQRYNIELDFHNPESDDIRLLSHIETALYRIIQEALLNVARHAKAEHVSIILEYRKDHVLLIIEDNGCGFDVESILNSTKIGSKLGLLGMQERVALVGGTLNIESSPERGTTVYVRVPIAAG